jgi:hypothetical protein
VELRGPPAPGEDAERALHNLFRSARPRLRSGNRANCENRLPKCARIPLRPIGRIPLPHPPPLRHPRPRLLAPSWREIRSAQSAMGVPRFFDSCAPYGRATSCQAAERCGHQFAGVSSTTRIPNLASLQRENGHNQLQRRWRSSVPPAGGGPRAARALYLVLDSAVSPARRCPQARWPPSLVFTEHR